MAGILVTLDTSHFERSLLNNGVKENMSSMFVAVDTSHLERSPLNDDAEENMPHMYITLDTSHLERSALNDDAEKNMPFMLVTLDTCQFEMSALNDAALLNMECISVTLDTSHLERSPTNLFAAEAGLYFEWNNNSLMSVTPKTSHDPIGPCGPLEQSEDSFRHSATAAWRSALDFGAHSVSGHYFSGGSW